MDGGDAHKFIQRAKFYETQLKRLKKIVLKDTKITEEEYSIHKDSDWFMDPEEALRYGVIDEIVENFDGKE